MGTIGTSDDDHIGASNEEVRALLIRCGKKLGIDYVPYEEHLSEDAKILQKLRDSFNKTSKKWNK